MSIYEPLVTKYSSFGGIIFFFKTVNSGTTQLMCVFASLCCINQQSVITQIFGKAVASQMLHGIS